MAVTTLLVRSAALRGAGCGGNFSNPSAGACELPTAVPVRSPGPGGLMDVPMAVEPWVSVTRLFLEFSLGLQRGCAQSPGRKCGQLWGVVLAPAWGCVARSGGTYPWGHRLVCHHGGGRRRWKCLKWQRSRPEMALRVPWPEQDGFCAGCPSECRAWRGRRGVVGERRWRGVGACRGALVPHPPAASGAPAGPRCLAPSVRVCSSWGWFLFHITPCPSNFPLPLSFSSLLNAFVLLLRFPQGVWNEAGPLQSRSRQRTQSSEHVSEERPGKRAPRVAPCRKPTLFVRLGLLSLALHITKPLRVLRGALGSPEPVRGAQGEPQPAFVSSARPRHRGACLFSE